MAYQANNTNPQIKIKNKMYDIEKYYSTIDNKKFKDKLDMKMVELIHENIDFIFSKLRRVYNQTEQDQMKTRMSKIFETYKLGEFNTYNYAFKNRKIISKSKIIYEGFEHGRVYSSTSIQGLQREIRHTIIDKNNSVDIDMINAHPCILNQVAKLLNVNTPMLNKYIINRDNLLKEIEVEYNLSHDEVKTIPLAIINGGIRSIVYDKINWLKTLEDEIQTIYKSFCQTIIGKRIISHVEKINKRNNKNQLIHSDGRLINIAGTSINLLLCKIEYEILTQCVFFFQSKDIEVYTLCFDGLIISKKHFVISELEEYVYNNLGLSIKFAIKPFDSCISDLIFKSIPPIIIDDSIKTIDFNNNGITFITANMGYGKTTQLYNYITKRNNLSVLIITPRKSLAKEFFDKFKYIEFKYYIKQNKSVELCSRLVVDEVVVFNSPRLICQIDSIFKINKTKFDIVILDEIETIFNHIVSFDKMKRKDLVFIALETVISQGSQIFVMDANLSYKTKDIFKSRWNNYKIFTDLIFSYQTFKDKDCKFIIGHNSIKVKKQHCNYVIKCLKDGKKVACPVSSKEYLKSLDTSVKAELPECKILLISIDENEFEFVDQFINYDLIIYTSILLCGNNFNESHFNEIIPYISNTHSSAKLYSQQMLRIRQFEKLIIFICINQFNQSTIVSEDKIITRWKCELDERNKLMDKWGEKPIDRIENGIKYNLELDEFVNDFYFKLTLKQTVEIENSLLTLVTDLNSILKTHGFKITWESIENNQLNNIVENKLIKYDKKEDFIKIIESNIITDVDNHTYTPHEYSKYIIKNTFNDIELINNDKMIEFVGAVHDKIYNHNNFMIFCKYGIDKTIYLHYMTEFSKLLQYNIFIPKSKATSAYLFSHRKGLEFIQKYNVIEFINKHSLFRDTEDNLTPRKNKNKLKKNKKNIAETKDNTTDTDNKEKPKEFKIDNKEFIEWFNGEDNIFYKISSKDINLVVTKTINNLLKIHGLTITSKRIRLKTERKRIRVDGKQKRVKVDGELKINYYIKTLIDYELLNIDLNETKCHDSFNFDELLKYKDNEADTKVSH